MRKGKPGKIPPRRPQLPPHLQTQIEKSGGEPKGLFARIRRLSLRTWVLIGALVGALSAVTTIYAFLPEASIVAADPLEPKEATSAPVIIRNEGMFAIHDVSMGVEQASAVALKGGNRVEGLTAKNIIGTRITRLKSHESSTLDLGRIFSVEGDTEKAEATLVVSFRPSFLPIRRKQKFRFETRRSRDGQVRWYPQALEK